MAIREFFSEDSKLSSMRLATVGTIVLFVPVFVVAWAYSSFTNSTLTEIPTSVVWLLGVLLTGKVFQKGVEAFKK